jgi:hypothetical protein
LVRPKREGAFPARKSETRGPKSEGDPRAETRTAGGAMFSSIPASDFGFPSDFGSRILDFDRKYFQPRLILQHLALPFKMRR